MFNIFGGYDKFINKTKQDEATWKSFPIVGLPTNVVSTNKPTNKHILDAMVNWIDNIDDPLDVYVEFVDGCRQVTLTKEDTSLVYSWIVYGNNPHLSVYDGEDVVDHPLTCSEATSIGELMEKKYKELHGTANETYLLDLFSI